MLTKVVLLVSCLAYCHGMQSLFDVLSANNGSTLVSLIKQANLTTALSGDGPFTVLVPTDAAFAAIPKADLAKLTADPVALANVLKYHVLAGEEFTFDVVNGRILSTISGHSIRLYEQGGSIFFNDAKVLKTDLEASNAVVYLIDRVLDVPEGTIMNILDSTAHNLTMFASLIRKARLEYRLNFASSNANYRYTIFAPSNAAFAKLPANVNKILNGNSPYLREVVDYHIHPGTIHIKSLDHAGNIRTLLGSHSIRVDTDNSAIRFNGKALLEESDIEAENGVVHVIDNVLIPSSLGHIIG
ncbi:hypothetical protein LOTGIDRAFT_204337 [Lottia gigantea]|uniref:FAS1 domain-containing protein n=1 Tax=Lottia gigantea TaxID=225164 RepID=V3ZYS6_LOTGI|nr:hypothetical protein LOTGIDRAFT_204337 [Lottia gigantea]ESO89542.1 hypothetical protein LOTGIDRAFT_204337 [Lottia gigantea]